MSRFAGLKWNAVANMGGNLASFGAVFIVTPIAIESLGIHGWGAWQVIAATTSTLSLLSMGMSSAVNYEVSSAVACEDFVNLANAISSARLYFFACASFFLSLCVLFSVFGLGTLVPESMIVPTRRALLLASVPGALGLALSFYTSVAAGLHRSDLLGLFRLLQGLTFVAATLCGFAVGMGLEGFAFLMASAPLIPAVLSWWSLRRLLPPKASRLQGVARRSQVLSMMKFGLGSVAFTTALAAFYQGARYVAVAGFGLAEVGYLGIAISLIQVLPVVFMPLVNVIAPRINQLVRSEGATDGAARLLQRTFSMVAALALLIGGFLFWRADLIFSVWVGGAIGTHGIAQVAELFRVLIVGQVFYVLAMPAYYSLVGVGGHRRLGTAIFVTACLSVALMYYLAVSTGQPVAVAVVFSVALGGFSVLVTLPLAVRRFQLRIRELLASMAFLLVGIVAPATGALFFLDASLGHIGEFPRLIADGTLYVAMSLPGLIVLLRWSGQGFVLGRAETTHGPGDRLN